jgi:hypothetical protein
MVRKRAANNDGLYRPNGVAAVWGNPAIDGRRYPFRSNRGGNSPIKQMAKASFMAHVVTNPRSPKKNSDVKQVLALLVYCVEHLIDIYFV